MTRPASSDPLHVLIWRLYTESAAVERWTRDIAVVFIVLAMTVFAAPCLAGVL